MHRSVDLLVILLFSHLCLQALPDRDHLPVPPKFPAVLAVCPSAPLMAFWGIKKPLKVTQWAGNEMDLPVEVDILVCILDASVWFLGYLHQSVLHTEGFGLDDIKSHE